MRLDVWKTMVHSCIAEYGTTGAAFTHTHEVSSSVEGVLS